MTQCKDEGYRAGMLAASEIANDFAIKCGAEAARYRAFANLEGSRAGSENMMERAIARTQCEGVAGGIAKTIRDIALNISAVSSPDNIDDLVSIFLSATSWTRQADTSVEAGLSAVLFAIGWPSKASISNEDRIVGQCRYCRPCPQCAGRGLWGQFNSTCSFCKGSGAAPSANAILAIRPASDALQAENDRLREVLERIVGVAQGQSGVMRELALAALADQEAGK